ncbi:protein-disulfide reductase DsbD domain-containing protein [Limimaricola pyoseonensis]|uniref:Thiol-disulfide interchange protein, contains DsbC and DsbD domains n=1 Tax=Limimaricola pyoseonensis TaxID=521013 RepID=A0A1G7JXE8_9RHOB|nr:protein-disulfide reductase DsbD domain-containing protein [Limimaricola pyoseonensis]SDF29637.1 Thiol-disulfide interchange protein, contains DsbC and DsbD domains [Limimaricola pyoseonensis]
MRQFAPLLAAALACGPALAGPADQIVRLDVLPGWRTETGTHMAGFRLTMAPGWKTYWRAPGEAGIPPEVDWTGSENVASVRFHWPVPEVFEQSGYESIGYAEQVTIPVELTPAAPGAPARMRGRLDIGVCEEVCVPVSLDFAADLPVSADRDASLSVALADRPMTPAEAGLDAATCAVRPSERGLALTATLALPPLGAEETVVVETGDPALWTTPARVRREGGRLVATTEIGHAGGQGVALDRSALTLTVLGGGRAVEISGCPAA